MKTSLLLIGRLFLFVAIFSLPANFEATGSGLFGSGKDPAGFNVGNAAQRAAACSRKANFVAWTFRDLFKWIHRGNPITPKANPGGPYNGISGTAITFNGSVSPYQ